MGDQIAALAAEQDALKRLLAHVQQNKIDQGTVQTPFLKNDFAVPCV